MHRINVRGTIRTVREQKVIKEYIGGSAVSNFGGMAGALGSVRQSNQGTMPTPTPSIDKVLSDWVDGSVQIYDAPTDTSNMTYHVMIPVSELWQYVSNKYFRAPKDGFDGMYQNFIKNGADAPVYVAVGKNNRVKITGNEDLIWYAQKAGLEELPVFFSYQKQV